MTSTTLAEQVAASKTRINAKRRAYYARLLAAGVPPGEAQRIRNWATKRIEKELRARESAPTSTASADFGVMVPGGTSSWEAAK